MSESLMAPGKFKSVDDVIEQMNLTPEELKLVQPLIAEFKEKEAGLLKQRKLGNQAGQQYDQAFSNLLNNLVGLRQEALETGSATKQLVSKTEETYLKVVAPKDGYNN